HGRRSARSRRRFARRRARARGTRRGASARALSKGQPEQRMNERFSWIESLIESLMSAVRPGRWSAWMLAAVLLAIGFVSPAAAQEAGKPAAPRFDVDQSAGAAAREFRTLDEEVQALKKLAVDLNRDLFLLEEELLFPSSTQVSVFVSMDDGTIFGLDSFALKLDGNDVANYLYTDREVDALHRGGVQRIFAGNVRAGEHELVAVFTAEGPHGRG